MDPTSPAALLAAGLAVLASGVVLWARRASRKLAHARSCLYVGRVTHSRTVPAEHSFGYPIFFCYVDLDELELLQDALYPLFGVNRFACAALHDADHFKAASDPLPGATLAERAREMFRRALGSPAGGPVGLLTHLSYGGYCFNPVSFYYALKPGAASEPPRVEAVVAEVSNTPWGEMHCYPLGPKNDAVRAEPAPVDGSWRYRFAKDFHVSPFMEMDHEYDWSFGCPGEELWVSMSMSRERRHYFSAKLRTRRVALGAGSLLRALAFFPMLTVTIQAWIHWEALRLWLKGVPLFAHPHGASTAAWDAIEPVVNAWQRLRGGGGPSKGAGDASAKAG